MTPLRTRLIRAAYNTPELRPHLLPLLKRATQVEHDASIYLTKEQIQAITTAAKALAAELRALGLGKKSDTAEREAAMDLLDETVQRNW
jgi:DNA polymerase III psi subunit